MRRAVVGDGRGVHADVDGRMLAGVQGREKKALLLRGEDEVGIEWIMCRGHCGGGLRLRAVTDWIVEYI